MLATSLDRFPSVRISLLFNRAEVMSVRKSPHATTRDNFTPESEDLRLARRTSEAAIDDKYVDVDVE